MYTPQSPSTVHIQCITTRLTDDHASARLARDRRRLRSRRRRRCCTICGTPPTDRNTAWCSHPLLQPAPGHKRFQIPNTPLGRQEMIRPDRPGGTTNETTCPACSPEDTTPPVVFSHLQGEGHTRSLNTPLTDYSGWRDNKANRCLHLASVVARQAEHTALRLTSRESWI